MGRDGVGKAVHNLYLIVKETGEIIHASEPEWCRVIEIHPGREWLYGFEEMKGQPNPDYDFDEPLLQVEEKNGLLQLTLKDYDGAYHADLYAYNRPVWLGLGGPERSHVGETATVEMPAPPVRDAASPANWADVIDKLDAVQDTLIEIKRLLEEWRR